MKQVKLWLAASGVACASAAAAQNDYEPQTDWEWACLETRPLRVAEPENLGTLIDAAQESFAEHPIYQPDELYFARSFLDPRNGNAVIVLRTLLLSDTEVVYVFDSEGRIVERFASSTWRSAMQDGPTSTAYRTDCRSGITSKR